MASVLNILGNTIFDTYDRIWEDISKRMYEGTSAPFPAGDKTPTRIQIGSYELATSFIGGVTTLGAVVGLYGALDAIGTRGFWYPSIRASEYAAKLRALIELPDPATVMRAWLQTGRPDHFPLDMSTAMKLHGLDEWAANCIRDASRHHLTHEDYWRLSRRTGRGTDADYSDRLFRTGLFPADTEYVDKILESILPADRIVTGFQRGVFGPEEAVNRLWATGLKREDAAPYLALSYAVPALPSILSLWARGHLDDSALTKWIGANGYDPAHAELIARGFQVPVERQDLDRLFFAGHLTEAAYRAGLRGIGFEPAAVESLVAYPYQPTPVDMLRRLFHWGLVNEAEVAAGIRKGGVRPLDASRIAGALHEPIPFSALLDLTRRGKVSLADAKTHIGRAGFSAADADAMTDLINVLPGPSDLIRMAVREAFTPAVVTRFGHDQEIPADFLEWGEKIGLTQEWSKRYWYAHWELPSVGQGMEMFHRVKRAGGAVPGTERLGLPDNVETYLSEEDFDLLLKTLDVSPFWRDRFKAVSYQPLARVDVRRAYEEGIVGAEEVYNVNRDLGYDDKTSRILTAWTHEAYTPRHLALLRDQILDALEKGGIAEDEAKAILTGTCLFRDETADFYIANAAYNRYKRQKELSQATIFTLYDEGLITEDDLVDRLHRLGYEGTEINLLLQDYKIKAQPKAATAAAKTKKPTVADLQAFLKKGVISDADFLDELSGLGYSRKYCDMYYAEALQGTGA